MLAALVIAITAGLALAWIDTRPGFDDTGVLVGLLVFAAIDVTVLDGGRSLARAALLGTLVGLPTPLVELANGGQGASIAALAFALAASLATAALLRTVHTDA